MNLRTSGHMSDAIASTAIGNLHIENQYLINYCNFPCTQSYTANKSYQLQPDYSQMAVILLELQSMAVHSQ